MAFKNKLTMLICAVIVTNLTSVALGDDYETLELVTTPGDSEALRDLAGLYRFGPDFYVPNTTIEFTEENGELVVEGFQPGALLRVADGGFIHRQHWFRVTFERDDEGRVTGIVYGDFKASREMDQ